MVQMMLRIEVMMEMIPMERLKMIETVTLIPQSTSIEVTKTATITDNNDDGENNAGDLLTIQLL